MKNCAKRITRLLATSLLVLQSAVLFSCGETTPTVNDLLRKNNPNEWLNTYENVVLRQTVYDRGSRYNGYKDYRLSTAKILSNEPVWVIDIQTYNAYDQASVNATITALAVYVKESTAEFATCYMLAQEEAVYGDFLSSFYPIFNKENTEELELVKDAETNQYKIEYTQTIGENSHSYEYFFSKKSHKLVSIKETIRSASYQITTMTETALCYDDKETTITRTAYNEVVYPRDGNQIFLTAHFLLNDEVRFTKYFVVHYHANWSAYTINGQKFQAYTDEACENPVENFGFVIGDMATLYFKPIPVDDPIESGE